MGSRTGPPAGNRIYKDKARWRGMNLDGMGRGRGSWGSIPSSTYFPNLQLWIIRTLSATGIIINTRHCNTCPETLILLLTALLACFRMDFKQPNDELKHVTILKAVGMLQVPAPAPSQFTPHLRGILHQPNSFHLLETWFRWGHWFSWRVNYSFELVCAKGSREPTRINWKAIRTNGRI